MEGRNMLKPDERLNHILSISESGGTEAVIKYFITELSHNVRFKHFDDKCYWINVEEVLNENKKHD